MTIEKSFVLAYILKHNFVDTYVFLESDAILMHKYKISHTAIILMF